MHPLVPIALLFVAAADAGGASALKNERIAVLEFSEGTGVALQAPDAMADDCRGAVVSATRSLGTLVLTRENMLEVLKATGGTCAEGQCEVETARNLNVAHFITGNVSKIDGRFVLTLKAYETRKGALLAMKRAVASSEFELLGQVAPTTLALLKDGFGVGATGTRAALQSECPRGTTWDGAACVASATDEDEGAWRDMVTTQFEAELRALAPRLAGGAKAVVIRGIDDVGTKGGSRATWLLNRMQVALSAAGVQVVEPPASWNGVRPVKPAERLVRCDLVERVDQRMKLAVVEATWKASVDGVAWQTEAPVVFPASLAPPGPRKAPQLPTRGDDVVLHVDARDDGSLCDGDRTQVFVTNRGPAALHVRVLNLDSAGNALVLFPNDQRQSDVILPGATVTLGDEGFEIAGTPGDRERYVVLAAKDPKALGRFARVTNRKQSACRVPMADAAKLVRGEGLDAPVVVETGFTIVEDETCAQRPRPVDGRWVAQGVQGLGLCW